MTLSHMPPRYLAATSAHFDDPTRRLVLGMVAGLAGLGLAGRAMAADGTPIRLGGILPLTGPDASVGIQQQRGLRFGVSQINAAGGVAGRPLDILYEDDEGRPDQAVISFNKLVSLQGVPLIFSAFSGPTLAMAPLATRKKIVLVNGGAQADRLAKASPYLFNTIPVAGDEIAVLAKYLASVGKKTAGILYEDDAGGTSGRDDFVRAFQKVGGKIIAREPVSFGQTDYRPSLLKIASVKPDVLFVMLSDGLGPLADQIHQMKPAFTIVGTSFFNDPAALHNPGSDGWLHTQVQIKAPPAVATAFQKMFNVEMEFWGAQYANAVFIMAKAIEKVLSQGKPITGENIHDAIFSIQTFDVMLPAIFRTNTAVMEIDIMQIKDGHHHLVQEFKAD
ncbi:ABC transporter substrate-binding protein [Acidisoma cellulosilytica]|uniref:ABC transporter substrate-binding protein n=1 Tax=Acidisoma cellulosilyticum TaxID=2802395 RepID=A0A963Z5N0_9PROT|nr:ABC transporter substrate-binding protein [Acidisoma cellulosilyticum]MCB8883093.1 ABC transporter substrate-binding protein [Acidisoma cellulosilyticum]